MTAARIAREVSSGALSAEAAALDHLERIRAQDPRLKAFLAVFEQAALEQARAVDLKRASGAPLGRLAGVPVAVKDNILVEGFEATCSSKILKGYKAPYDAAVIERLRREDAVLIGKTNLDEFAMGSSTENSAFFATVNPWSVDRVPGGSSGGSAAAVASRMCAAALGSDTGGSIRQPASFCGLVGVKPTYGLVSRYGLVAYASSLDQIGPLARTVEDAALLLSVIAGPDPRDSTSAAEGFECDAAALEEGVAGLRIGLPREYFAGGMDAEVERNVREAVEVLKGLGASVYEVSLPHTKYAVSSYYVIAPSEASSNLARFDGIRYGPRSKDAESLEDVYEMTRGEGFGPEVKRRVMLGVYALSAGYHEAYYGRAQRARALIRRDFDEAFGTVDVIAAPTAPTAAFKLGEKTSDPLSMYLSDIFTIPSNMAGNASLSVPCGLTKAGLPIGLQLVGPAFREGRILRAARALERARPFPGLN